MKDNLASTVPDVDEAAPEEGSSTGGNTNGKVSYEAMANHPDVKAAFNERIQLVISLFLSLPLTFPSTYCDRK